MRASISSFSPAPPNLSVAAWSNGCAPPPIPVNPSTRQPVKQATTRSEVEAASQSSPRTGTALNYPVLSDDFFGLFTRVVAVLGFECLERGGNLPPDARRTAHGG